MEPDFFAVADRLCDLYITYRRRYVVMQAAPELEAGYRIYMPKSSSGPVKLTNRAVCRHLNRQIAISVFAGAYSSKFICFDVDYPDLFEVKKLIEILNGYGVSRDLIYVSTSGGKGYHVEIFFDGLVYTEQLRKFYDCVCVDGNFDPHKIEFRPTNGQAIKLPLSVHFKTGRVCWYLDRDTLQPIEDPAYVDRYGFQELHGFLSDQPLKNAEMQMEDDYGMIDGIINNGKRESERPSVAEQLRKASSRKPKPPSKGKGEPGLE